MKIALGSDHRGYATKERMKSMLTAWGHAVIDCGAPSEESCDYPDYAIPACLKVAKGEADRATYLHAGRNGTRIMRSFAPMTAGDPESGSIGEGHRFARLIRFSSGTMKDRLQQLISSGRWTEPAVSESDPVEKEYRRQMTAEFKRKMEHKVTHKLQWIWVCPSHNNHAFDCAAMQVLGATMANIVPDHFTNEDTSKPEDDKRTSGVVPSGQADAEQPVEQG